MQPPNTDYLSAFNSPSNVEVIRQNKIMMPKNISSKIKAGFTILFLIWIGELISEINTYNAIANPQNDSSAFDQTTLSEYPFCNPNSPAYDFERCSEQLANDLRDSQLQSQGFVIIITTLQISGWVLVFLGLMDICSYIRYNVQKS
tara:strand:- start:29 stop:466 length:438 start_codon:yes stop_codon:yes gene_type:complete